MPTTSTWLDRVSDALWSRQAFSFQPVRVLPEVDGRARPGSGPRVAFAGFPSDYSLAFLLALLAAEVTPAGIITSPRAHPAILGTNALSQVADHCGIPLLRLARVNDEDARVQLTALRPDAIVMASFDQIIRADALAIPRCGWLNAHPSRLPLYRGPEPVYWTIVEAAEEAGITLHLAAPRFDTGPILAQRVVAVDPADTAGTLTRRLCAAGVEELADALARRLDGDPGVPANPEEGSYRPSVGHRHLDAAPSAADALRMVRAGVPDMPAWTELLGRPVYVLAARLASRGDLHFPDSGIELVETVAACSCHDRGDDCPRREGA